MSSIVTVTQTWRQLTSIYVGGAICLPMIVIGQELCQHYGLAASLVAIIIGNVLLLLLGLVVSFMSTSERKSTVEHAQTYFGKRGSKFLAVVMIASMLSWFAIQLNMMGLSILKMFQYVGVTMSPLVINLILGAAMTLLARSGMRALSLLSTICLPLMVATMGWAIISAETPDTSVFSAQTTSWLSLGSISLVMAASIACVIDTPTFFRYAHSARDGIVTTLLMYCLALPLIEGVGIYLAASMPGATILETLQGDRGILWNVWVVLFLLLAGWTTNNTNLFSAVVAMEPLMPNATQVDRTLLMGGIGTLLSCADLLQHLEGTINMLGVSIGSMGGVMLTGYLLGKRSSQSGPAGHLSCWMIGFTTGVITIAAWQPWMVLSGIPLLDAYFTASLSTVVLSLILKQRKRYEESYDP